MRTVLVAIVCLLAVGASAADSPLRPLEVTASGGFSDGPGYASRAPGVGATASIGTSWLRVYGGASYSWLHKDGTSGGYQRGVSYSVEPTFRNAFLFAGMSGNFTNQTEYTKTVRYRFFGVGYRWARYGNSERARSINEVRAYYYRESFSTYANETQQFAMGYNWDRQVRGALYVRVSFKLGAMYFNDNPYPGAARRQGMTSTLNIGFVGRP